MWAAPLACSVVKVAGAHWREGGGPNTGGKDDTTVVPAEIARELERFVDVARARWAQDLLSVVLFGSWARGEARAERRRLDDRLRTLGAQRRIDKDGFEYWDLKPNYQFGEVVEL